MGLSDLVEKVKTQLKAKSIAEGRADYVREKPESKREKKEPERKEKRKEPEEPKSSFQYKKPIGPDMGYSERQRRITESIESTRRRQESEARGTTLKDLREMKKRAEKTTPYKPHGTWGQTVKEKIVSRVRSGIYEGLAPEQKKVSGKGKRQWLDRTHYSYEFSNKLYDTETMRRQPRKTKPERLFSTGLLTSGKGYGKRRGGKKKQSSSSDEWWF